MARLDAHDVRPEEYEGIPGLKDEFFDKAEIRRGDKLIRRGRGRPPLASPLASLIEGDLHPEII